MLSVSRRCSHLWPLLAHERRAASPPAGWQVSAAASSGRLGVLRQILGFHTDAEMHWVADLECGHTVHVRHDPPWQERPWVLTPEGRQKFVGTSLRCVLCATEASPRTPENMADR